MSNKKACVYGIYLWIKFEEGKIIKSDTYFDGAFKKFFCECKDEICNFKNPEECDKYQKFLKE